MKYDYDAEAARLAKAMDILIEAFTKYPPQNFPKENVAQVEKVRMDWKQAFLYPEPKFRKKVSLKYHIEDVFTYFRKYGIKVLNILGSRSQKKILICQHYCIQQVV